MLEKGHNIIDNMTSVQNWENETDSLKNRTTIQNTWQEGQVEKSMEEKWMKLKNHETSAFKVVETYELK